MKIIAKTDIGRIRSTNEDTFVLNQKDNGDFLAFVCDGMGGHLGGAFAASTTAQHLNDAFENLNPDKPLKNVAVWLFETLQTVNSMIYEQSLADENLKGMGTTISGVIKYKNDIFYAHVGDSRVYVYNDKQLEQITTDHTYVNTLLLNGLITFKQALKHPKRHVLTNALGIKRNVSVDIGQVRLKENDNLLICTDGLHNTIENKKLFKLLNEKIELDVKADNLIEKALSLGGTDNITFILVEQK